MRKSVIAALSMSLMLVSCSTATQQVTLAGTVVYTDSSTFDTNDDGASCTPKAEGADDNYRHILVMSSSLDSSGLASHSTLHSGEIGSGIVSDGSCSVEVAVSIPDRSGQSLAVFIGHQCMQNAVSISASRVGAPLLSGDLSFYTLNVWPITGIVSPVTGEIVECVTR